MAQDIMSDNQTESVLSLLDRGEADDKTRDRVSAALLRSQTKLVEVVETLQGTVDALQRKLWSFDQLDSHIDARHGKRCSECPARRFAEDQMKMQATQKPARPWYMELLMSESVRYFVLVLIFAWALVVMKTSTDEAAAVMENVAATLTGGVVK